MGKKVKRQQAFVTFHLHFQSPDPHFLPASLPRDPLTPFLPQLPMPVPGHTRTVPRTPERKPKCWGESYGSPEVPQGLWSPAPPIFPIKVKVI